MIIFESKAKRTQRIAELKRENQERKKEAEAKGLPFFGSKYEDQNE